MFQLQDILERPVKVIGDVSYLLKHLLKGVAYDSPGWPKSTSNL
jgi:hypothetical protein